MIRLRAHHILCLHGFKGEGYSTEFVDNMRRVHQSLKDNPESSVQVTDMPDDICAACPNLSNEGCFGENRNNEVNIAGKDSIVMARLNILPGDIYTAVELFNLATDCFAGGLRDVCSSCKWFESGWCEKGLQNNAMSS
ncbi:MAG: DUF1284 domain-containing protein [Armatimonadota bacterium]